MLGNNSRHKQNCGKNQTASCKFFSVFVGMPCVVVPMSVVVPTTTPAPLFLVMMPVIFLSVAMLFVVVFFVFTMIMFFVPVLAVFTMFVMLMFVFGASAFLF